MKYWFVEPESDSVSEKEILIQLYPTDVTSDRRMLNACFEKKYMQSSKNK